MRQDVEEAFDLYDSAIAQTEEMLSVIHRYPVKVEPLDPTVVAEVYLGRKLHWWELFRLRWER